MNINVKKFNEALVNGGRYNDSLKVAKCLAIDFLTRMKGITNFAWVYLLNAVAFV